MRKIMKNPLSLLIIAASLAVFAPSARAATYAIDKAHSTVSFKIRHLAGKVQGWFKDFDGAFEFDPAHPEKSSVQTAIQVASIDTRNEKRDEHLKSPDFFDAEKFPAMAFKSASVKKTGDDHYQVAGVLSLHGVDKPVTLEVDYGGEEKMGNEVRAGFSAATKIKRTDFNIVWNKALDSGKLILGDDVDISIEIEAVKGGARIPKAGEKKGKAAP